MKKRLSLAFGFLIISLAFSIFANRIDAFSSEPLVLEWDRTYGGIGSDKAYSLVKTNDGGFAVAGDTNSFGAGGFDFWLVKTDAHGNEQWNKTYGGMNDDSAFSMVQTDDGGYALAGYTESFGAGPEDFYLVKTNSTGGMEWNKTYGGTGRDLAYCVIQTVDGGYAIAGHTHSFGAAPPNFWLVKTNSTGDMEWSKTYGGNAH